MHCLMKVAIPDCFHQIAFKTELIVCFRHTADRIPARMQFCLNRLVVRTARCGRANPGSIPGSHSAVDLCITMNSLKDSMHS